MALSDQLTDLANRTRQLEDAAATTRAKDRTKLEEQREKLQSKVKTEAQNPVLGGEGPGGRSLLVGGHDSALRAAACRTANEDGPATGRAEAGPSQAQRR